MPVAHHTAICVRDLTESLRFWRDGLGFEVLIDETFSGDWRQLFRIDDDRLHSVFLGEPGNFDSGIVELVDFGDATPEGHTAPTQTAPGFLLVSVMAELDRVLIRLAELRLGGEPRRIEVSGVAMAVVVDPDGVQVELIDTPAERNLERLADAGAAAGRTDDRGDDR